LQLAALDVLAQARFQQIIQLMQTGGAIRRPSRSGLPRTA
jgi:hypothetical protein